MAARVAARVWSPRPTPPQTWGRAVVDRGCHGRPGGGGSATRAGRNFASGEPSSCDVVIADDGLQHLALRRDVEIALIDERMLGNGWVLPAGLCASRRAALIRSTRSCCMARRTHRLRRCALLQHAYGPSRIMRTALATARRALRLDELVQRQQTTRISITAAAGIGVPQRFFDMLSAAAAHRAAAAARSFRLP